MSNRKKTEEFIYKFLRDVQKSDITVDVYKNVFAGMSDVKFDKFIKRLENKEEYLNIFHPNFEKTIKLGEMIETIQSYGIKIKEEIWVKDEDGEYALPNKALVLKLPVRIQSQRGESKVRAGDGSGKRNMLTDQVAGTNAAVGLSTDESRFLQTHGLDDALVELLQYRGGDIKARDALSGLLSTTGEVSIDQLKLFEGGAKAGKTLEYLALGMGIVIKI